MRRPLLCTLKPIKRTVPTGLLPPCGDEPHHLFAEETMSVMNNSHFKKTDVMSTTTLLLAAFTIFEVQEVLHYGRWGHIYIVFTHAVTIDSEQLIYENKQQSKRVEAVIGATVGIR